MGILTDANGNTASIAWFGTRESAQAALDSVKYCRNCVNCSRCSDCLGCLGCSGCSGCSRCSGCSDCSDCLGCSGCSGCSRCSGCSDCSDCSGCSGCSGIKQAGKPLVVGPVRSDGYQFVMGASRSVHAGCRVMISLAEAREHWTKTRGDTKLGRETMLILDYLEKASAL